MCPSLVLLLKHGNVRVIKKHQEHIVWDFTVTKNSNNCVIPWQSQGLRLHGGTHSFGRTLTEKDDVHKIIKNISRFKVTAYYKPGIVQYERVYFSYLQQSRRNSMQVDLHLGQNCL